MRGRGGGSFFGMFAPGDGLVCCLLRRPIPRNASHYVKNLWRCIVRTVYFALGVWGSDHHTGNNRIFLRSLVHILGAVVFFPDVTRRMGRFRVTPRVRSPNIGDVSFGRYACP